MSKPTPTPADRISDLPDDVLKHILSFLHINYAMVTIILSRRWRNLWTLLPNLNLDFSQLLPSDYSSSMGRTAFHVNKIKYDDLVTKAWTELLDMSFIHRFRLASCMDSDLAETWIHVAVMKNMQELHLDIEKYCGAPIHLPESLFTCKSLVYLKLTNSLPNFPAHSTSICFPKLRTLHLVSIEFSTETNSFSELVSLCPVLENLFIVECRWVELNVVHLDPRLLPTVKNLCMLNSYAAGYDSEGIRISIPSLISFKYMNDVGERYYLNNLSSLADAFIGFKMYRGKTHYSRPSKVIPLLQGVSNARFLTLTEDTLEELSSKQNLSHQLPLFQNLNKLILSSGTTKKDFRVIADLLRKSPWLKSLVIDIKPPLDDIYEEEGHQERKRLYLEGLFLDQLKKMKIKELKIRCFGGSEYELEFFKLFLRNANTEKLEIIKAKDLPKRFEHYLKTLMFQRASENCILNIL